MNSVCTTGVGRSSLAREPVKPSNEKGTIHSITCLWDEECLPVILYDRIIAVNDFTVSEWGSASTRLTFPWPHGCIRDGSILLHPVKTEDIAHERDPKRTAHDPSGTPRPLSASPQAG